MLSVRSQGQRIKLDEIPYKMRPKASLALFSAELWAFEVVLLKQSILRKMHIDCEETKGRNPQNPNFSGST